MHYLTITLQLIVGLSILNVWLIQNKKPTQWRGGDATSIKEEFSVYGLPDWSLYVVGFSKVLLAIGLILAIWFPILLKSSAMGLATLLLGSVVMHFKIKDPLIKSFPAFLFLCLCLYLVIAT
ncbi:DoxX family protein [Spongiivirga sp. MCCC 1A20706]|uniref:DoxX family protein n=1 Tax=Spongiivirga sp. MCCC 1A20706 TaxID=3160963 RepID=UPI0039775402